MTFIFLSFISLPLISFLIYIQIILSLFFFVYYVLIFFYSYFSKIDVIIEFREECFRFDVFVRYTLLFLFVYIPQSNSYLIFYNLVNYSKNYKRYRFNLVSVLLFFVFTFFKLYITFLIGYSILVLKSFVIFLIKLNKIRKNNFVSYYSLWQHIIINTIVLKKTFNIVNHKRIILNNGVIILNPPKNKINFRTFVSILNKFSGTNLFYNSIASLCEVDVTVGKYKHSEDSIGHFQYEHESSNPNKPMVTNLTSSEVLNVKNSENNFEQIKLKNSFSPNIKDQSRENFFTPPHTIDKSNDRYVYEEITENDNCRLNLFSEKAKFHIASSYDKTLLHHDSNNFYYDQEKKTIYESLPENCMLRESAFFYKKFKEMNPDKTEADFDKLNNEFIKSDFGSKNIYTYSKEEHFFE